VSGGTHVTITGEQLNTGAKIQVLIGGEMSNVSCEVDRYGALSSFGITPNGMLFQGFIH
jgi:hypothetical protein